MKSIVELENQGIKHIHYKLDGYENIKGQFYGGYQFPQIYMDALRKPYQKEFLNQESLDLEKDLIIPEDKEKEEKDDGLTRNSKGEVVFEYEKEPSHIWQYEVEPLLRRNMETYIRKKFGYMNILDVAHQFHSIKIDKVQIPCFVIKRETVNHKDVLLFFLNATDQCKELKYVMSGHPLPFIHFNHLWFAGLNSITTYLLTHSLTGSLVVGWLTSTGCKLFPLLHFHFHALFSSLEKQQYSSQIESTQEKPSVLWNLKKIGERIQEWEKEQTEKRQRLDWEAYYYHNEKMEKAPRHPDPKGYYHLFGLEGREAEVKTEEINRIFKELAKEFHPDTQRTAEAKHLSSESFQRISEAYSVLKDDEKRQKYDSGLI